MAILTIEDTDRMAKDIREQCCPPKNHDMDDRNQFEHDVADYLEEALNPRQVEEREITKEDVLAWQGDDHFLDIIVDIANGEYKAETLRSDIIQTLEQFVEKKKEA